ncbi:MAG: bifunctional pyr operon transcriptional regulator/uracil phosphoribosyltransferase PyrR [Kiritimatiellaeota bacterium]|nr:bifunctional pyr operon transcriptional regulator/uracil phosphoribosyltransferase PyrR [Kiritimatiellota bacterium]
MNEKLLFDSREVVAVIDAIAEMVAGEIKRNHIENVALIGIQLRGVPLARRIAGKLNETLKLDIQTGSLDISMYRDDIGKRKKLTDIHETDIAFDIDDKSIILVDDILHTGRTIRAALDAVTDYGRPKLIKLAVFIDRGGHEFPISADYAGKTIDLDGKDGFVSLRLAETDAEDAVYLTPENPHTKNR